MTYEAEGCLGRVYYHADVGFIKQRVPLGVFTTMLWCGVHEAESSLGRVYYHVVMWDSSNRVFLGRVYYRVVMWGSSRRGLLGFTTML